MGLGITELWVILLVAGGFVGVVGVIVLVVLSQKKKGGS